jgi:hypothetical protein
VDDPLLTRPLRSHGTPATRFRCARRPDRSCPGAPGSEFDYTTEQIRARRVDDDHWVVTLRLEGTFPGGVAELDYRFALREGLVTELVIANHVA